MTPEELLRSLAVLMKNYGVADAVGDELWRQRRIEQYREWVKVTDELNAYLPAPTITPEGLRQLELGEGGE